MFKLDDIVINIAFLVATLSFAYIGKFRHWWSYWLSVLLAPAIVTGYLLRVIVK
jgi:hypothetical protein